MSRRVRLTVTAILSITFVVGGLAVAGVSAVQIYSSAQEQDKDLLPSAQAIWLQNEVSTIRESASVPIGTFLGTINIPSIKKTVNIFQGTDTQELKEGVGHYVGSVLPGVIDNSVLSGHRDTVFSNLGKVKLGSSILITTQDGIFNYKVERIRIVDQNDRTVIVPTKIATLTLSTCYPFTFIGSAPKRYVVVATLRP